MKIISNKKKLLSFLHNEKNLGFVPTMGAIHLGHISLIKKSISQCNKTIVTIFINKPQFNRKSDYKKYPRVIKKDISIIKKLKVDYLFLPKVNQIYPDGPNKNIKISALGNKLCGKFSPKHFEAVVDVIDRFIKIIRPQKIYLGEKDYQQYKIIESFVSNNFNQSLPVCFNYFIPFTNDQYDIDCTGSLMPSILAMIGFIGNCMLVVRLFYISINHENYKCIYYSTTFLMIIMTISSIASILKTFQNYNHILFLIAETCVIIVRMICVISFWVILLLGVCVGFLLVCKDICDNM